MPVGEGSIKRASKTTAKTTAKATPEKKTAANVTAEKTPVVQAAAVIANCALECKGNEVCHLTEELPVHLL